MAIDYERVMWDTTKYVNPQNMNQMDEGIKAACDAVDNMSFDETMTYAEYQALTPEQKADGTTRYIPDYNIGQSVIDNDSTSGTRTWGADKLSSNFSAINSKIDDKHDVVLSNLNSKMDTQYCYAIEKAGFVFVYFRGTVSDTIVASSNVLSIENGYRVSKTTYTTCVIKNRATVKSAPLRIGAGGEISVLERLVAGDELYADITYIK